MLTGEFSLGLGAFGEDVLLVGLGGRLGVPTPWFAS